MSQTHREPRELRRHQLNRAVTRPEAGPAGVDERDRAVLAVALDLCAGTPPGQYGPGPTNVTAVEPLAEAVTA